MESQTKWEIDYNALSLPAAEFHPINIPSPKVCPQNCNAFLHQYPLMNASETPFDPFLHGSSSSGLGFRLGAAMQGGQFLNFSNAKDILMELGMASDRRDLDPVDFVIPDESSCVTNGNNAAPGRNSIKRSRSINKNNISSNGSAQWLSTKTSSRGSKKSKSTKGQWTVEEDNLLIRLVEIYGVRKWSHIAHMMKRRIGKQCRERWHNHLRPDIKKDQWTEKEDRILIETHSQVGNKWAEIAKRLPGRTENSIKNHWNATKRRQFSRRKCRTKWPKPSHILQNYIKSLYLQNGSDKDNNTITPPTAANPETLNENLSDISELDLSHVDHTGPEYDLDDVLDFTFDDFQALERSSMGSSLDDVPNSPPLKVDDELCFDFELPFDVDSIFGM